MVFPISWGRKPPDLEKTVFSRFLGFWRVGGLRNLQAKCFSLCFFVFGRWSVSGPLKIVVIIVDFCFWSVGSLLSLEKDGFRNLFWFGDGGGPQLPSKILELLLSLVWGKMVVSAPSIPLLRPTPQCPSSVSSMPLISPCLQCLSSMPLLSFLGVLNASPKCPQCVPLPNASPQCLSVCRMPLLSSVSSVPLPNVSPQCAQCLSQVTLMSVMVC